MHTILRNTSAFYFISCNMIPTIVRKELLIRILFLGSFLQFLVHLIMIRKHKFLDLLLWDSRGQRIESVIGNSKEFPWLFFIFLCILKPYEMILLILLGFTWSFLLFLFSNQGHSQYQCQQDWAVITLCESMELWYLREAGLTMEICIPLPVQFGTHTYWRKKYHFTCLSISKQVWM